MNEMYEYLDKDKCKKTEKIRKNLGDNFHLGMEYDLDNEKNWYIKSWKLFEEYDNPKVYFSKDNTPLMDSEHDTLDELYEFSKQVKEYDEATIKTIVNITMIMIVFIIATYLRINCNMKYAYLIAWIAYAIIILEHFISFFFIIKKSNFRLSKLAKRRTRLIKEENEHE